MAAIVNFTEKKITAIPDKKKTLYPNNCNIKNIYEQKQKEQKIDGKILIKMK